MQIFDSILPAAPTAIRRKTQGAVVHTTGGGLAKIAAAGGAPGSLAYDEAAISWYHRSGFAYFGAFIVGTSGRVWRLAPDRNVTWHSANLSGDYDRADWRRYAAPDGTWVLHDRNPDVVYDWWLARWPTLRSPVEILGRAVNSVAVGIDLLPGASRDFSSQQLAALAELLRFCGKAFGFEVSAETVVGHADVDPARRGTLKKGDTIIGKPWDPGITLDSVIAAAR